MNLPKNFLSPSRYLQDRPRCVLVALSGGADSVSLLDMTIALSKKEHFSVCAAHVNHNIRTEQYNNEALRDENFCRQLCENYSIPLFVLSEDIPRLCRECGESAETIARRVRYDFFAKVMREQDIKVLLTAHNADDNLETQIFNLCRGTGIQGISGIPQVRPFPEGDGVILRPMLAMTKAEILEYCKQADLKYVTDSTNLSVDYTRNKIRHSIIPSLEEMFDSPQRSAYRLALSAREDADFILGEARSILKSYPEDTIPLNDLNSLHPALKARILALSFEKVSSTVLEGVHINALISLAKKAVPHSSVSLPDKLCGRIEDGSLVFMHEEADAPCTYNIKINEGFNKIPSCDFAVMLSYGEPHKVLNFDDGIYNLYTLTHIKNATILSLSARPRTDGDTIRSGGMTKKVKKLFCEKKVPLSTRASIPLIFQNDELIYVPLCATADGFVSRDKADMGIFIYQRLGGKND